MNRITNVLVIVDPTASEHPAVEKAAMIASQFGARVELFACETKESRAIRYAAHLAKGGQMDFIAHIRAVLDGIAEEAAKSGVDMGSSESAPAELAVEAEKPSPEAPQAAA